MEMSDNFASMFLFLFFTVRNKQHIMEYVPFILHRVDIISIMLCVCSAAAAAATARQTMQIQYLN